MTAQMELGLEVDAGALPLDLFEHPPLGDGRMWRLWEREVCDLDRAFPIETVEGRDWKIYLRAIEGGAWLWGCDWWSRAKQQGGGFAPYRKWGPFYATMSREASIAAARLYIAERMAP